MNVSILGAEVGFGLAVQSMALAAGLVLIVWPIAVHCRRLYRVRRAKRVRTARLTFVGDVMRAMNEHDEYLSARTTTSRQELVYVASMLDRGSSTQQ